MIDKEKDEQVTKAMDKIKKEKVEVKINPKKFLLEYTLEELKKLEVVDTAGMDEKSLGLLEEMKKNYKENIEKYTNAVLEGVMVPLKYRDIQMIKIAIMQDQKALKTELSEMNFSDDIKVLSMIREEHTLTIYFSLRKKDNLNERYFKSLEEIGAETETTIEELYSIYFENFVLSETERKNS